MEIQTICSVHKVSLFRDPRQQAVRHFLLLLVAGFDNIIHIPYILLFYNRAYQCDTYPLE